MMKEVEKLLIDPQDIHIHVYQWLPDEVKEGKIILLIAHGMAETAKRYERLASFLTEHQVIVYAHDHRGHGKTAKTTEEMGYVGRNGFDWMVKNMRQVHEQAKKDFPDTPIFLLGHSMGSFLTQQYMADYGYDLQGVILSGSNGKFVSFHAGRMVASIEHALRDEKAKSPLMDKLSFGGFNKQFKSAKTPFDWLSRDADEVQKYIDDPHCGAIFTTNFYKEFTTFLTKLHRQKNVSKIPKNLPIFLFAGDQDPVGRNGAGVKKLYHMYQNLQIQSVDIKLYEEGRHEMLNETNREEVMQDIHDWLERHRSLSYHKDG
ncbi:alpha/beta fold hydrolase [Longirhabdus pacifica]|uniref:alpha/beta fold hydrolase n=1 Tax=Longirhabdus pacifica TaxID=2305227 RepID=UPI001F0BC2B3|nr:alpha/beta fold hydrolase [Longirhabdus pacifica]